MTTVPRPAADPNLDGIIQAFAPGSQPARQVGTARVQTSIPADSLRWLAKHLPDMPREDDPRRPAARALRDLARYAPSGQRMTIAIEWRSTGAAAPTTQLIAGKAGDDG